MPPLLDDGTPFPTRFWLSCPLAVRRIARFESSGAIRQMEERRSTDPDFARGVDQAHRRYADERDVLIAGDAAHRPQGGVGGAGGGIKCLHAHYADHVAGGDNPAGQSVADQIEPLDCLVPCVTAGAKNPAWREPR
ncbi:MAG: DUF501 domain-containing protein [Actinomycetota bacterium]